MRPKVKLWEIATIQAWWTPNRSKKEYYEWWNIPWLKSWELNDSFSINENEEFITKLWMENSSAKLFKKWTLLMAMYWATAWKLWILNIDATTNQAVCSIQNTKWLFDNLYVFYYLFLIRNKIIIDSFWWAQPNISKDYIKNIEIPLPPLETQKAIVAKLDQIFAELDQTKSEIQKNLDNTDELWKSALNQAFQGDWEMKKLGEVCDKVDNVKWRDNISYKYIDLTSVDRDYWNIYDTKIINSKTAPSRAKQIVKYNDILFWTTRPTQLRRCIIPIEYDNQISSTWFCVIRLKKNLIPSYLYFLLETQSFFDYVEKYQSWAGYPAISDKKLKEFCIPVPPLSEQEKIVEHLYQVSKEVKALKSQYQSQLDNLEESKKSVLDKAFRWEFL